MRRIAKDTPVGTRVLVVRDDYSIARDTTRDIPREVAMLSHQQSCWLVDLCGEFPCASIDRVYLDEPEPGTCAWAHVQALAGKRVRRSCHVLLYGLHGDGFAWFRADGNPVRGLYLDAEDAEATDWEIAE